MRISAIKYSIIDSLKSLKRNSGISTASAATVAATLFILGIFFLTILNVNRGILSVESKVEVKIFLKNNITSEQQKNLENKIKSINGVLDVSYETKTEAINKFKEQLGSENKSLTDGLEKDNPMPNSYVIKVEKPEVISDVVNNIKGFEGIESIKDAREVIEKLMSITRTLKWIGSVMFVILIGISLFLIGNTIKITVYSRRREIGIMKYIGATDWFIRWPFIIEGIIIGIIGAIVSDLVLYYAYKLAYIKVSSSLMIMQPIDPQYVVTNILGLFLISGIAIGSLGSIISIRKFLHV
ncbi:permease-like cell division protein FtsX [Clostridium magnum]|uniref:Cell division protein FtsX n=1 Tax=Clostridium magnum DSM 2767 TaxID=1121326 RepID=A0A162TQ02_9CLOT|nr:permease-like cell division protein FtsX [Clostridium magnum]KZL92905.1 cell division protein FtsX [Clostridium magnum DSM 2767]SHJ15748.1 cell division transport system permease protein [Clostridium magnum DSM 2767]